MLWTYSVEERDAYEDHLKWLRIEANTLKKAEARGMEKGVAIGEARGVEKGLEQASINMLKQKLDPKLISAVTGMSIDKILKLKNEL